MNEKITYASAKPTEEILTLFERAKELDADGLGNAEVLERAGHYLVENEEIINFKTISRKRKKHGTEFEGDLPSSFKVRINDSALYSNMIKTLQRAFNINRVMTPFLMRISLSAYIDHLLEDDSGIISQENTMPNDATNNLESLKLDAISKILDLKDKESLMRIISEVSDNDETSA